MTQLQIDKV